MLVIEREIGQSFYMGDNLDTEVKVLGLSGNGLRIRIGIAAPKELPIHRNKACLKLIK